MPELHHEAVRDIPSARGVNALRLLMREHIRGGSAAALDPSWRAAARELCDDAHARALRVEQLLISLKGSWAVLADAERVPRGVSAQLLARLVTLCVEEYYAA